MGILSSIDIDFWRSLFDSPLKVIVNSLDILIVAFLIYRFIRALRGTKIMTLVQGVVLFIFVKFISDFIGFTTISYLMNQVINYGAIAAVVIFAPELRSALETFGRTPQHFLQNKEVSSDEKLVQAFVKAAKYMSPRKIGALVSIEQTQTLQEQIVTGIPLDAVVTGELLINIFIPNTPLHDGAVIIRDNKVVLIYRFRNLIKFQRNSEHVTGPLLVFQSKQMLLPLSYLKKQVRFPLLIRAISCMDCPFKSLSKS